MLSRPRPGRGRPSGLARHRGPLLPEGWRLHAQVDDLDWTARELARRPCRVRVLAPQELRERLAAQARRLLIDCTD